MDDGWIHTYVDICKHLGNLNLNLLVSRKRVVAGLSSPFTCPKKFLILIFLT